MAELIQTKHIPWSGYWWPSRGGGLATGMGYRGHPSPLEKYLLLTEGVSSGPLINWYLSRYYNPSAESWEGLCPLWARASMLEDYDIFPSSEDNMIVRVGDKKGLLTLCHDYAITVAASGDDPVEFHFWLLDYIRDQGIPFLADMDAGREVWYHPIYGFDMTTSATGNIQTVRVSIKYAADNVHPDYIGTLQLGQLYTYELYYNARQEITGGAWTGGSVYNHPDVLVFPLSTGSKTDDLDCDVVRRLAKSKDDFLEMPNNAPGAIQPGAYNLVLLNEDRYVLEGRPGDAVSLEIQKDDSSEEALSVLLTDGSGEVVDSWSLLYQQQASYTLNMENPPYTLSLTQENYEEDPNIYALLVKKFPAFHQNAPYIPRGGAWSGFVLHNNADTPAERVALVISDGEGKPVQTVFGPVTLKPGEKQVLMLDDLPYRPLEFSKFDSLMMISDQPVTFLNLFGQNQKPMAGFVQGNARGRRVVIPDTVPGGEIFRSMKAAVFNESLAQANMTVSVYSADGGLQYQATDVIAPGGKYTITPGQRPFNHVPDGGWMDIAEAKGNPLSAYLYIQNSEGKRDAVDTVFALPVGLITVDSTPLYVPHVTPPAGWWRTRLTLINPGQFANPVTLHLKKDGADKTDDTRLQFDPYEKQVIDLTDLYGMSDGAARSILEISGQYPLVGYYTYSPPTGKDEASFPLLTEDALADRVAMPHYAGQGGYFWTGVCVCNPNHFPVDVAVRPFDAKGVLIEDLVFSMPLESGEKDIFVVGFKFGKRSSEIAYIEFQETDGADVGGFYLFGNMKEGVCSMEMLTGANM